MAGFNRNVHDLWTIRVELKLSRDGDALSGRADVGERRAGSQLGQAGDEQPALGARAGRVQVARPDPGRRAITGSQAGAHRHGRCVAEESAPGGFLGLPLGEFVTRFAQPSPPVRAGSLPATCTRAQSRRRRLYSASAFPIQTAPS